VSVRPKLLFVSPRFLLPADSGGKIRTGQILRGMKDGDFEITLASPAPGDAAAPFAAQLGAMCDRFVSWPEADRGRLFSYLRLLYFASPLPISVATDKSTSARKVIDREIAQKYDVIVVDFIHGAVLVPERLMVPSVLFTHNVEAEIFERHLELATNPVFRSVWRDQLKKMRRFERHTLRRFDTVVAVSDRDKSRFQTDYSVDSEVIATGVDLEFFQFQPPRELIDRRPTIVFTASMDSLANIDGVQWFMDAVWPRIASDLPSASVMIVGRNPDPKLVRLAQSRNLSWTFTGSVDDVRPFVHEATLYVIPLRIGGGTRIKAYEAMALGRPVVSTTLGVEGLQLVAGSHYLAADSPDEFAASVVRLSRDYALRRQLADRARSFVEQRFSSYGVARAFEAICRRTLRHA
jgi:polysaccharide biosynthesis protein PslH